MAAASDLTPLRTKLSDSFSKTYGVAVRFVFGSSGMLAQQIRNGAPYDVYLCANEGFVNDLASEGHLLRDSVRVYALGRIAMWSPDPTIRVLDDLARPRVKHVAIANPGHAPYGQAARQAIRKGRAEVESKLVMAENVRQALQFAESGNAEAAVVAWSLVIDRGGILLPEQLHDPIRQAGGVLSKSRQAAAGRRFLEFLASPPGRRLLEEGGFSIR